MPELLYLHEEDEMTPGLWETLKAMVTNRTRQPVADEVIQTDVHDGHFIDDVKPVTVFKDDSGRYNWIGTFTNSFRDNDGVPELFSSDAHRRYVDRVDKGELPLPMLDMWHEPEWKIGKASFVALDEVEDGIVFVVAGGPIDEDKYFIAEAIENAGAELKMSHAVPGEGIQRNKSDMTVFDNYWSEWVTMLPSGKEANPLTNFGIMGDYMSINPKKRKAMMEALNIDEGVLDKLEGLNAGLAAEAKKTREYKSQEETMNKEEIVEEKPVEETPETVSEEQEVSQEPEQPEDQNRFFDLLNQINDNQTKSNEDIGKSFTTIGQTLNVINTSLSNITERLEAVEKAQAEDAVEKQAPAATSFYDTLMKSIVGSKEAEVKEGDPLKEKAPVQTKARSTGNDMILDASPFLSNLIQNGQTK